MQPIVMFIIDTCFRLIYMGVNAMFFICRLPLFLAVGFIQLMGKFLQLVLTFLIEGIQGVQRALRVGTYAEKIHYAVLKENGQYLKLNKTLEEIFTCQLYDYCLRSISPFI